MIAVVTVAEINKIVRIRDVRAVKRDGVVFVSQVQRIRNYIVVGSGRPEILREGIVRSELDPTTGLIPAHLKTVVVCVVGMLQGIDVLIEGIRAEEVSLRGG